MRSNDFSDRAFSRWKMDSPSSEKSNSSRTGNHFFNSCRVSYSGNKLPYRTAGQLVSGIRDPARVKEMVARTGGIGLFRRRRIHFPPGKSPVGKIVGAHLCGSVEIYRARRYQFPE